MNKFVLQIVNPIRSDVYYFLFRDILVSFQPLLTFISDYANVYADIKKYYLFFSNFSYKTLNQIFSYIPYNVKYKIHQPVVIWNKTITLYITEFVSF